MNDRPGQVSAGAFTRPSAVLSELRRSWGRSGFVKVAGTAPWLARAVTSLCVVSSLLPLAGAASDRASEYRLKASFLINFTKFVDWPESAFPRLNAPFNICVVGEDPFGSVLDKMALNEAVGAHPLVVRRIQQPEATDCHLIFMRKSDEEMLPALGAGALTVGESELFLRDGGMINFVGDNRRVRFDINPAAAEAAQLKISSKLIKLARSVEGKTTKR